jgi:enoyl-CoA hydratase/carnithine racemase
VPELLIERPEPAIAVLTLNRPERRNALSVSLRDTLSDALDQLADDEEVKVVVVTGAGEVFCAGFDLGEFDLAFADPAFAETLWASSDRYHHTVIGFPLVTIAAVNGPAIAGGFDLAICCDLRVAATTARFSHPEYTFGQVVYAPLHDLVGGAIARELTMTGRQVDADEALALHLVSSVVDPSRVLDEALAMATRVAMAPRDNLRQTKAKALRRARLDPRTGTLDL